MEKEELSNKVNFSFLLYNYLIKDLFIIPKNTMKCTIEDYIFQNKERFKILREILIQSIKDFITFIPTVKYNRLKF